MIIPLVIERVETLVQDVRLISFTRESAASLQCRAGQYLTFLADSNDPSIRRSYSIATSPELNEPLTIGVRRIENGLFSRFLVDWAKAGDILLCTGSGGLFTLPNGRSENEHLFLFAAGSGIVPIFSLIKTALYTSTRKILLVFSNRSERSTMFRADLLKLQEQFNERFDIIWLFGNNHKLEEARLHPSLLESILVRYNKEKKEGLFYICGPESYMRFVGYVLRRNDVPAASIKREVFHSTKVVAPLLPPDQNEHLVFIELGEETVSFTVQYPQTILQAAMQNGVDLPYSCAAGRCGNCVANCISGRVWMSYNEVLTESDLAAGKVLTCTGYPVDGDVSLSF